MLNRRKLHAAALGLALSLIAAWMLDTLDPRKRLLAEGGQCCHFRHAKVFLAATGHLLNVWCGLAKK